MVKTLFKPDPDRTGENFFKSHVKDSVYRGISPNNWVPLKIIIRGVYVVNILPGIHHTKCTYSM